MSDYDENGERKMNLDTYGGTLTIPAIDAAFVRDVVQAKRQEDLTAGEAYALADFFRKEKARLQSELNTAYNNTHRAVYTEQERIAQIVIDYGSGCEGGKKDFLAEAGLEEFIPSEEYTISVNVSVRWGSDLTDAEDDIKYALGNSEYVTDYYIE